MELLILCAVVSMLLCAWVEGDVKNDFPEVVKHSLTPLLSESKKILSLLQNS